MPRHSQHPPFFLFPIVIAHCNPTSVPCSPIGRFKENTGSTVSFILNPVPLKSSDSSSLLLLAFPPHNVEAPVAPVATAAAAAAAAPQEGT